MRKTFMGVKLRALRAERGLSQTALAQALELSPSYLNQLEQNQRPLTVQVLLKLHRALGVDIQQFSEDEEARLIAGLREALADAAEPIALPELQEVAAQMPALGRALIALHRRALQAQDGLETLALRLGDERSEAMAARAMPFEVVRDFFFDHQNHFDAVDRAAEALAAQAPLAHGGQLSPWLAERLQQRHGVRLVLARDGAGAKRSYDPGQRLLLLSPDLEPAQQAFQLATQLALLEIPELIAQLTDAAPLADDGAARSLARIGLANYFAGALLLPYTPSRRRPRRCATT